MDSAGPNGHRASPRLYPDTTRREHLLELQRDFGFRSFSATIYRELAGWLLPIALSTDVGPGQAATTCGGVR